MGTTYEVQLADEGVTGAQLVALREKVEAELEAVNAAMSTYRPDSEISRFNRTDAGVVFPVSPRFREVMRAAFSVHEASGGVFEPTLGPLVDVWGFGAAGRGDGPPSDTVRAEALARVGLGALALSEAGLVKSQDGVELNLSAIAKGYGVDRVLGMLVEEGWNQVYVEIGGEVACRGRNDRGTPWVLGIQVPVPGEGVEAVRRLLLEDRALATSGDYRNFYESDGIRRHHILDPRTGGPATHGLASVSVLARDCMTADAVATALYVMGSEEGMRWLADRPGLEALFIDRTGDGFRLTATRGFEAALLPEAGAE